MRARRQYVKAAAIATRNPELPPQSIVGHGLVCTGREIDDTEAGVTR